MVKLHWQSFEHVLSRSTVSLGTHVAAAQQDVAQSLSREQVPPVVARQMPESSVMNSLTHECPVPHSQVSLHRSPDTTESFGTHLAFAQHSEAQSVVNVHDRPRPLLHSPSAHVRPPSHWHVPLHTSPSATVWDPRHIPSAQQPDVHCSSLSHDIPVALLHTPGSLHESPDAHWQSVSHGPSNIMVVPQEPPQQSPRAPSSVTQMAPVLSVHQPHSLGVPLPSLSRHVV